MYYCFKWLSLTYFDYYYEISPVKSVGYPSLHVMYCLHAGVRWSVTITFSRAKVCWHFIKLSKILYSTVVPLMFVCQAPSSSTFRIGSAAPMLPWLVVTHCWTFVRMPLIVCGQVRCRAGWVWNIGTTFDESVESSTVLSGIKCCTNTKLQTVISIHLVFMGLAYALNPDCDNFITVGILRSSNWRWCIQAPRMKRTLPEKMENTREDVSGCEWQFACGSNLVCTCERTELYLNSQTDKRRH